MKSLYSISHFLDAAGRCRRRCAAFSFVVLGLGCAMANAAKPPPPPSLPLQDGERLVYRVSWAVVPGAGEIKISAQKDPKAPDQRLIVTSTTATRRLARMLLPFDAESDSVFDLKTGQLLSLREKNNHRGRNNEHLVTFDYATRQATYAAPGTPSRLLPMPEGDPVDLIMGLLETRGWNLGPGEKREALILFDDDFYELTIHFARYEEVRTPIGTFKTTVLEPRMDRAPPKGMFKRGSKVRVWIAQNDHHLPVKFEVEFKIGTGTATIESYTPPAGAKVSESTTVPAGSSKSKAAQANVSSNDVTPANPAGIGPTSHAANPRP